MKLQMRCPYDPCGKMMQLFIDTQGDPDVGMQPNGLEEVTGCIHAEGVASELENNGEESVKIIWPTFAAELDKVLDSMYREQLEWSSHDEDEEIDDEPSR